MLQSPGLGCAHSPTSINRENTLAMAHMCVTPFARSMTVNPLAVLTRFCPRRRNPALDGHFDRMNLLLWPRLKVRGDSQAAAAVDAA